MCVGMGTPGIAELAAKVEKDGGYAGSEDVEIVWGLLRAADVS